MISNQVKGLLKEGEGVSDLTVLVVGRVDKANEYAALFKKSITVVGDVCTQGFYPAVMLQAWGDITVIFKYVTL